jgi:hypothetical protein
LLLLLTKPLQLQQVHANVPPKVFFAVGLFFIFRLDKRRDLCAFLPERLCNIDE